MTVSLVQLYPDGTADEIVLQLRRAADVVASETAEDNRTVAFIGVQVAEDGAVEVYGWGKTDRFHCAGVLQAAIRRVL